jgi:hypothetical protein
MPQLVMTRWRLHAVLLAIFVSAAVEGSTRPLDCRHGAITHSEVPTLLIATCRAFPVIG